MKDLRGRAATVVPAPRGACLALLEAVDRYPAWYPAVVRQVEVLERDADGAPVRAHTKLHVSRGAIVKDFDLIMAVTIDRPSTIALAKVGASEQRFDVTWHLSDDPRDGTQIALDLFATLNVPRFLPVGGIGDSLAHGFVRAAGDALASGDP